MSAVSSLLERFSADPARPLKLVGATGQLGYGIPATTLPRVNSTQPDAQAAAGAPPSPFPRYATYQEYYTPSAIDCVESLYRRDVELFGYAFE